MGMEREARGIEWWEIVIHTCSVEYKQEREIGFHLLLSELLLLILYFFFHFLFCIKKINIKNIIHVFSLTS